MKKLKYLIGLIISIINSVSTFSQVGTLDVSFGGDGIVQTDFSGSVDRIYCMEIQSDGKILAGGYTFSGGTNGSFALVRYNSSGSIDQSFALNGISTIDIGTDDQANAISVDMFGNIFLVGSTVINGIVNIALIKYLSNGFLDNTFGANGIVTTSINLNHYVGSTIALQPDNKILVGGISFSSGYHFCVARYNQNGTLDTTFGVNGIQNIPVPSSGGAIANANKLVIQPDGKIVLAGRSYNGNDFDIFLMRLSNNGNLDVSFGNGGMVITDFSNSNDQLLDIILQSDGKIIGAGRTASSVANTGFSTLIRYSATGMVDSTFGINGSVLSQYSPGNNYAHSIILQPDGKILITGSTGIYPVGDIVIARYTNSGSLDLSFSSTGYIIKDIMGLDVGSSIRMQTDGKILVGGFGGVSNGLHDFILTRYNNDINLGIDNVNIHEKIKIYPNPTTNILNISHHKELNNVQYSIFNSLGSLVDHGSIHQNKLNISNLNGGMYFITFFTNNYSKTQTIKFIKTEQ